MTPRRRSTLVSAVLAALAVVPTPGMAQGRSDRTPTIPPPTITEYKPRSTLVVPEHPVPRAKFPAVDFHYFDWLTRPSLSYVIGRLGLRKALHTLGRVDYQIIKSIPWLKYVSSSVVIRAAKHGS